MLISKSEIRIFFFILSIFLLSCSCNKNDDIDGDENNNTITDVNNNVYKTVTIGTQTWMAENLRTTKYNNGDPIFEATQINFIEARQYSSYRNINYNDNYTIPYGREYNYLAIKDPRNICPKGWHIPSKNEWGILIEYLISMGFGHDGSGNDIAKSLASTTKWTSNSLEGTPGNNPTSNNSSGFNGFPAGVAGYQIGSGTGWMSSTLQNDQALQNWTHGISIRYNNSKVLSILEPPESYQTCRCIKD